MSNKQHQITAIIQDRKGRVLSVGQNSYVKTHTLQAFHARKLGQPQKIYLHAEISAITKCHNINKAYSISVYRYDSYGNPANASPCPICMSAIKEAGIKVINHT